MAHTRHIVRHEPVTPPGASPDTPILVDAPRPRTGAKRRRPSSPRPLSDDAAQPSPEGAVAYSPMLPHGFAMHLPPGAVAAATAARVAFSLACLRSTGPVCRNVVGPLAHTLGRYFAGGGRITVAGRTGSTREYRSVEALVSTRRSGFGYNDARAAACRWLAACALSQVNVARWHPRRFAPPDAALDAVYAYLAAAAAPVDLLGVSPTEMHAWIRGSDDLRARLSWAMLYATAVTVTDDAHTSIDAAASYEQVDAHRLTLALDALPRQLGLPMAAPMSLGRRQTATLTPQGSPSRVRHDAPILCGCPSTRVCTAWGPERSVGAWQRSAIGAVAFVVAAPARAAAAAPLGLGVVPGPSSIAAADIGPFGGDHMSTATASARRPIPCGTAEEAGDRDVTLCIERVSLKKQSRPTPPVVVGPTDDDSDPFLPQSHDIMDTAAPCRTHSVDDRGLDKAAQDESFWQWLDEQFPCEPLPFISPPPFSSSTSLLLPPPPSPPLSP